MDSLFLLKFNNIAGTINHSDMDGPDWLRQNQLGGLSQSIPEWQAFLEYVHGYFLHRDIKRPIVLEIGTEDNYQRRFYEELLDAEYIGIDSNPKVKGEIDILGNSRDEAVVKEVKVRLASRRIDLLFLDGDHSYAGVKEDYEIYGPLTANLIALHDIFNTKIDPNFPPVETHKLWRELCKREKHYTLLSFHKQRAHERDPWVELGIGLVVKDGE